MRFHHFCVAASDYEKSVEFYAGRLGMTIHRISYSANRNAKKLELYCNGQYMIELFVMEECKAPKQTYAGLDHVSFLVEDAEEMLAGLEKAGVPVTEIRTDRDTGKKYGFCFDPDGTKIEFYSE